MTTRRSLLLSSPRGVPEYPLQSPARIESRAAVRAGFVPVTVPFRDTCRHLRGGLLSVPGLLAAGLVKFLRVGLLPPTRQSPLHSATATTACCEPKAAPALWL